MQLAKTSELHVRADYYGHPAGRLKSVLTVLKCIYIVTRFVNNDNINGLKRFITKMYGRFSVNMQTGHVDL